MQVRNLADIDELGPATARGEAEKLAESTAAAIREQRRRYEQELAGLQRKQAADNLRQRFVSLVRDTIAAGCAASRSNGAPGADPITIWYDLGMDAASPWAYARAMQVRLGVPISELITADLSVVLEPISPRRWADIRQRSGADLTKLIDEFSR